MAYTTIDKPSNYFEAKLYTGNESNLNITGLDFAPSLVWIKDRTTDHSNCWYDSVRGVQKRLQSNNTEAEGTDAQGVTAFNSDGFTIGNSSSVNQNNDSFVSWNWKAGGSGSTNTDGSVNSTVSANATAGFSIVEYNTAGSGTQTVGHGLNSAPTFIITKPAQNTESWYVYIPTGVGSSLRLNTTAAAISSTPYAGTPTDTLFSINNGIIGGYSDVISYCFTDVKGYSKFGSYVGNGNADGTFVYTGFKPAWVMVKNTNAVNHWAIYDNKRIGFNTENNYLRADGSYAEGSETWGDFDLLSNGFKPRATDAMINSSGNIFIYMAFAENPFVASNFNAATAR